MNKSDVRRNYCMLEGPLAKLGYDWWWHSFTGHDEETGEPRAFFIEYFLCNPDEAQDEPVIVWNDPELQEKGVRPSYLMVKAGSWGEDKAQLHRFMPWRDVSIEKDRPINLRAQDCILREGYISGLVSVTPEEAEAHPEWMSDAGQMKWNLAVDKQITFNVGYGASPIFRTVNSFQMFWHAEGMKTEFTGEVIYNGRKYIVDPKTSYGYADKNWGSDFTSPWLWISSCNLKSARTGKQLENSVFDIGGGMPRVYGVPLGRQLLGAFFYEGKNYEFNFSKAWTDCRTKFSFHETDDLLCWKVEMRTIQGKMKLEIFCEKKDAIFANYEAPNGTKRFKRLWNCGTGYGVAELYQRDAVNPTAWNLVDEMYVENAGCEYGEYE